MEKVLLLDGLDCANCAAKIEKEVSKLPDVVSVSVSFLTQKMVLELSDNHAEAVTKEICKLVRKHLSDVTVREL